MSSESFLASKPLPPVLKWISTQNILPVSWERILASIQSTGVERGGLFEDWDWCDWNRHLFLGHPLPFLSPNKFIHVSISISPDRHVAFDVFSLVHLLVGSSVLNDSWYIGSELYYYLVLEIHSSSPVSIVMLVMLAEWEISLSVSASPGFPPTSRHHQHGR